jgi:hypothetical protein
MVLGSNRFTFWGNGGVVHGRGFESLTFGVNGGVVHGREFAVIFDFCSSMVV